MTATGGGQGKVSLTEMGNRIRAIIADVGIATEDVPLDSNINLHVKIRPIGLTVMV